MTVRVAQNDDSNVLRVFIVRHGQTDDNLNRVIQGHKDSRLNETGLHQAELVGRAFKLIKLDGMITSDLSRCTRTAEEIVKHQEVAVLPLEQSFDWREQEMGGAQGMPIVEAVATYGPDFRKMSEKEADFLQRVDRAWCKLLKRGISEDFTNYAVCSHGGVLTMYMNHLYKVKQFGLHGDLDARDLRVPFNTSVTIVDVDKRTGLGTIQDFGNTDHLGAHHLKVVNQNLR